VTVVIGLEPMSRAELISVARLFEPLALSDEVLERLRVQRAAIDVLVDSGEPIYGLSTGFGSLATTSISPEERKDLQRSLIRSHAAGVGPEVENEVVRAMMVSRLTNLCSGVSGVRPSTALAYGALLNAGITPIVHEFGSLGCSGDLAPLAHVALALMGEGDVRDAGGTRRRAVDALAEAGLSPVELAEKEGLALINAPTACWANSCWPSTTAWHSCAKSISPRRCRSKPSAGPIGSFPQKSMRCAPTPDSC